MTPEEVAAVAERARGLLSLASRDQIYEPSRTTTLLANDVLALAELASKQAAALARVEALRSRVYPSRSPRWVSWADIDAALAGEQP